MTPLVDVVLAIVIVTAVFMLLKRMCDEEFEDIDNIIENKE